MLSDFNGKFFTNKVLPKSTLELNKQRADGFIELEQIIPGIYLTSNDEFWTLDRLKSHGFTYIIYIDKENNSTTLKSTQNNALNDNENLNNNNEITKKVDLDSLKILNLVFGTTYLVAVLPNCYKAVKFIDKALTNGDAVLVFESSGYQKCVTIAVGYLMFKYNLEFTKAFDLVKSGLNYIELDIYYRSQLKEYEPILQVQRTQLRGHSFSGELLRARMKRKKQLDDFSKTVHGTEKCSYSSNLSINCHNIITDLTDVMEQ